MPIPDIIRLLPECPVINVVDVGAMSIDGAKDPYQPLLSAGIANVIGFEPVEAELTKLNASAGPRCTYLPYAVGDGTAQRFNICNFAMTSSLLQPNHDLIDHFTGLSGLMQVVRTVDMQTRRLDDIDEVTNTDFLKLDAQGAELQVLRGAHSLLGNLLMVQTEVEFVQLYRNQPLFADIDVCLREYGFLFHRFTNIAGRPFHPLRMQTTAGHSGYTQALWADAIYVRNFCHMDELDPASLQKLAVLAHVLYGSFDLAFKCLAAYDRLTGSRVSNTYLRELTSPA